VPGRGGRENGILATGEYGEYPNCRSYQPEKVDKMAVAAMRTGVKMRVNMCLDMDERSMAKPTKKDERSERVRMQTVDVWGMMGKAGIEVEKKPDEVRGWRK
jgi:hypothetical protein